VRSDLADAKNNAEISCKCEKNAFKDIYISRGKLCRDLICR